MKTIKVQPWGEDQGEYVLINEEDFDAKFHEPFDEGAQPTDAPKIELGTDSGEEFSDEQLRDAIEAASGQRPHHMTGRAKLIAQFNELNAEAAAE
ncbi:hypothetical protein [Mesorhizobium sp. Pch-S]|uniref:hypothetical protein n=1 Tax=Mesorhizobium sp. Pch-S TaxID=2082387 RepID=UPI001010F4BC|nr:hypothetical protein [Mesorhizobium sp. Pch-S]QAZ45948.1 hypothetical protein C1M53_26555 [Mesorhizobium sp. Pch-S]